MFTKINKKTPSGTLVTFKKDSWWVSGPFSGHIKDSPTQIDPLSVQTHFPAGSRLIFVGHIRDYFPNPPRGVSCRVFRSWWVFRDRDGTEFGTGLLKQVNEFLKTV